MVGLAEPRNRGRVIGGDDIERFLVPGPGDLREQVMRIVGRLHDECARRDDLFEQIDGGIPLLPVRADPERDRYDRRVWKHGMQEGQDRGDAMLLREEIGILDQIRPLDQDAGGVLIHVNRAEDGLESASRRRERAMAAPKMVGRKDDDPLVRVARCRPHAARDHIRGKQMVRNGNAGDRQLPRRRRALFCQRLIEKPCIAVADGRKRSVCACRNVPDAKVNMAARANARVSRPAIAGTRVGTLLEKSPECCTIGAPP